MEKAYGTRFLNSAFEISCVLFSLLLVKLVCVYLHTFLFVYTLLASPSQEASFIKGVNIRF